MTPVKLLATVGPDGTLTLGGLPFPAGEQVEVTVAEVLVAEAPAVEGPDAADPTEGGKYPLRGTPGYYIDPFKPAWDDDEWECDQ